MPLCAAEVTRPLTERNFGLWAGRPNVLRRATVVAFHSVGLALALALHHLDSVLAFPPRDVEIQQWVLFLNTLGIIIFVDGRHRSRDISVTVVVLCEVHTDQMVTIRGLLHLQIVPDVLPYPGAGATQ